MYKTKSLENVGYVTVFIQLLVSKERKESDQSGME